MSANITLMLDPTLLQPTAAFVPLIWPVGAIIAALIAWVLKKLFGTEPNGEMRKVLILGTAGSGKTTLWGHLRGANKGISKNTMGDKLEAFEFAKNAKGEPIWIDKTEDVAGMDEFVRHWKAKIEDNSFLLFVFDVRDLDRSDKVKSIKTRLRVIAEAIKEKGFKNNVAMYWVGTHLDMTSQSADHYRKRLVSILDIDNDKHDRILIGDLSKPDGSLYLNIYKVIKDGLCG